MSPSHEFSLEECYSNIFALASLKEIHCRRYQCTRRSDLRYPIDDPVFRSFADCQERGILSAWRRVLSETSDISKPYEAGNYDKELWVFWHGNSDPVQLRDCISPELTKSDHDQVSCSEGSINYETRTILFKAIHNTIERCLNSKGYIRLGKWFVQPVVLGVTMTPPIHQQFTLSLSYFLHGDNVCASVEVRLFPQICKFNVKECTPILESHQRIPVILAPFGLHGEVISCHSEQEYSSEDHINIKIWRKFYPQLSPNCGCVDVLVGNQRMVYPCDFVFSSMEDIENCQQSFKFLASRLTDASVNYVGKSLLNSKLGKSEVDSINLDLSPERLQKIGCTCKKSSYSSAGTKKRCLYHKRRDLHSYTAVSNVSNQDSHPPPVLGVEPPMPTLSPQAPLQPGLSPPPLPNSAEETSLIPPVEEAKSEVCVKKEEQPISPANAGFVPAPSSVEPRAEVEKVEVVVVQQPGPDLPAESPLGWLPNILQQSRKRSLPKLEVWEADLPEDDILTPQRLQEWRAPAHKINKIEGEFDHKPSGAIHTPMPLAASILENKPTAESLIREEDIKLSYSDLDNIFDSSSPEPYEQYGDYRGTMSHQGPFSHPGGQLLPPVTGSSIASSTGSGIIPASDLSRIYPTPPSLENHILSSPAADIENQLLSPAACSQSHYNTETDLIGQSGGDSDWSFLRKHSHFSIIPGGLFSSQSVSIPAPLTVYIPDKSVPVPPGHRPLSPAPTPPPNTSSSLSQPNPPFTPATPGSHCSSVNPRTPASVRTPGQPVSPALGSETTNALLVNLHLSDSLLNLYKDRNFEVCNMCVCNNNTNGSEVGLYVASNEKPQIVPDANGQNIVVTKAVCSCGFSAMSNKKFALGSNIFYEDFCELTGTRERLLYEPWPSQLSPKALGAALSFLSLTVSSQLTDTGMSNRGVLAEFRDWCENVRVVMESCSHPHTAVTHPSESTLLHNWSLRYHNQLPMAKTDLVRLLKTLRPWFQDALYAKLLGHHYVVSGPMTWQEFHRMAGRGSEETCEPQPLPQIAVYAEKEDGILLAPSALRDWERLGLEPYSRAKKIQYVVLCPADANHRLRVLIRRAVRELSVMFAECRLGEHVPASGQRDILLSPGELAVAELPELTVVYMPALPSISCQNLLSMVQSLPATAVLVPLSCQAILAPSKGGLRSLALQVYSLTPKKLVHSIMGRTLCGFGPSRDKEDMHLEAIPPVHLHAPAFILSPLHSDDLVLLCAYCLSENQRWLLATLTDDRGEVYQRRIINLQIPERHRRRKICLRQLGPEKLWEWICDLPVTHSQPWRLVVCRIGRLGHGELTSWAALLTRSNLQAKGAISAALCALDADPHLRVLPDQADAMSQIGRPPTTEKRPSSSITHILVLPTSASFNQATPDNMLNFNNVDLHVPGMEINLDDMFANDPADNLFDTDFFNDFTFPMDEPNGPGDDGNLPGSTSDGSNQLMQQPLALGYYLSTAPVGYAPYWFRVNTPEVSAACFRASLHLNLLTAGQNASATTANGKPEFNPDLTCNMNHPLNTYKTTDVLRYVLETYHCLSWLTIDPGSGERSSCLPQHVLRLFQLYQAIKVVSSSGTSTQAAK